MKKYLQFIVTLLFAFAVSGTWAQERTVSGKVTSVDDGAALPGVNVVVKGTTQGTVTDVDGNYKIAVPSDGTLVFSFIGFATQEVNVSNRAVIDVQMSSDVTQLGEVVVVGYGEVDKRKLISSVSSVDGAEVSKMPVMSFDQALQGKAAGVQVTTTSGILGSTPKVRIRGINSITSGTSPLYVIDGVPMPSGEQSAFNGQTNALADLNPKDIESYEVLKDGAATAIYGSRAANGVILITTKTGKAGQKPTVSYDFSYGLNQTANRFDLLNAEDFILISNEKFASAGISPQAFPGENNVDTDWQDEIFRTGRVQQHNLGIRGGSEDIRYFVSLGLSNQEGSITNNSLKRYSARANVDYTANDWLSAGVKLQYSQQTSNGLNTTSGGLSGNIANATKLFPNVPVFDPDHPTGYNLTDDNNALGRGNNLQNIAFNLTNIRYVLDKNIQETVNNRLIGNTYLKVDLPKGVTLKTQIAIDITDTQDFQSQDPVHGDGNPGGFVFRGNYTNTRWNWQNTVGWRTSFADVHNINLVAGTEYQKIEYDWFNASGTEFSDPLFIQNGLISGSFNNQFAGGFYGEEGFASLFSRFNYDYDNRYLLSLSVRQDAVSNLPEANREDVFFGGSLGWNIAREAFFDVPFINDLKIRGSWAQTGNTAFTGLFPAAGTYGPNLYGSSTALSFEQVGNPDLRWEITNKTNFGVDFTVLDNRIEASVDYFLSETEDLILQRPTDPTLGVPATPTANRISQNIGALENSGLEVSINSTNLQINDFRWTSSFNISFVKNEVTKLVDGADILGVFNIIREGEPIGSLYGWESAGVNPANGNPLYNTPDRGIIQGNPDDNSYYLYNPNSPNELTPTTALGEDDKKVLGQTLPEYFGGFTNSFTYKGFDLSVALTYAFGHKIFNGSRQNGLTNFFQNNTVEILNRWTPQNTDTDIPRLSLANDNFLNLNSSINSGNTETRFMEDADYVRVQNVTLGYTLPSSILERVKLKSVRVFFSGQNLHVFTGYKGLDPELNVSRTSNLINGVDLNTNPLNRTYTFGINVTL